MCVCVWNSLSIHIYIYMGVHVLQVERLFLKLCPGMSRPLAPTAPRLINRLLHLSSIMDQLTPKDWMWLEPKYYWRKTSGRHMA